MKIVLPVHHFPPRYNAGAELYTFRLARWLQQHGHIVTVVCLDSISEGRSDALTEVSDVYREVPVQRLSFDLINAPERQRWDYDNDLLGQWFTTYLSAFEPDLVHLQAGYLMGIAPLKSAVALGVPIVLTLHDYWYLCPRHTLQRGDGSLCETIPMEPSGCVWCRQLEQPQVQWFERLTFGAAGKLTQVTLLKTQAQVIADRRTQLRDALQLPAMVIAPSQFLARQFAALVPAARMQFVPYGLDLQPFAARQPRRSDDVLRIGYIGQIADHKGVHLLVRAFRQLKRGARKVELHLHGSLEGSDQSYVRQLKHLAANDPQVYFHGRFDNARVAEILSALSLTVAPSVWYENRPLAILEAQATGLPVVTARLGGMAEMVRDGVDGLHFVAGDADDLAKQLQRLLDDPTLLARLRTGVETPRSIDDEMQQLTQIYRDVLSSAPRRAMRLAHSEQMI